LFPSSLQGVDTAGKIMIYHEHERRVKWRTKLFLFARLTTASPIANDPKPTSRILASCSISSLCA
jgi:hypothetical protein